MKPIAEVLFIVGVVAAAVLVAGCTSGGNQDPSTNASSGTPLLLNESTNGSTIAVPLHATLTLELMENPSTGYAWNLSTTSGLRIEADAYVPDAANASFAGAGGVHRWKIVAVATGLQEISAVYGRSLETPIPPEFIYSVEVSVTS